VKLQTLHLDRVSVMAVEHLRDDILEQYLLGYLPEWRLPSVEEHILGCQDCATRAEEMQAYIQAARNALRRRPD